MRQGHGPRVVSGRGLVAVAEGQYRDGGCGWPTANTETASEFFRAADAEFEALGPTTTPSGSEGGWRRRVPDGHLLLWPYSAFRLLVWFGVLSMAAVTVASISLLASETASPDTNAISAASSSRPCLR